MDFLSFTHLTNLFEAPLYTPTYSPTGCIPYIHPLDAPPIFTPLDAPPYSPPGCTNPTHIHPQMHLPHYSPPGASGMHPLLQQGCTHLLQHGCTPPAEMATAVVGTHPTECILVICIFLRFLCLYSAFSQTHKIGNIGIRDYVPPAHWPYSLVRGGVSAFLGVCTSLGGLPPWWGGGGVFVLPSLGVSAFLGVCLPRRRPPRRADPPPLDRQMPMKT